MKVRLVVLLACVLTGIAGYSQDSTSTEVKKKKTFRPDIPGSIMIEFGFNFKNGLTPPEFSKSFWGSRTLNIYYQYPIRLFKSNISFNPGIGLSLERWKFDNDYTFGPAKDPDGTYSLVHANNFFPGLIKRSQLINNYLEMPVEFKYDTNPEDIARSFSFSVGARFGVLYDSFTKVDYKDAGEEKSNKDKQWHGMNSFRYGMYMRAGLGGFGLVVYYNMSEMFKTDMGPGMTTMNSVTVGISVNGF